MDPTLTLLMIAIGGAAIGAFVAWIIASRQIAALTARAVAAETRLATAEQGEQRLREAFSSLSRDALRTISDEVTSGAWSIRSRPPSPSSSAGSTSWSESVRRPTVASSRCSSA